MINLKKITSACIALLLLTISANAQLTETTNVPKNANEQFIVKYIGSDADYLLFTVEFNIANNNFALLKINDKEDGELYSQRWNSSYKKQTFKIELKEGRDLNFKLISGDKVFNKKFSAKSTFIQQTTVSENETAAL